MRVCVRACVRICVRATNCTCMTSMSSAAVGAVWTVRGNSDGAPCVFPFTYQGIDYNKCIDTNWDGTWCATTGSYDADNKWSVCTESKYWVSSSSFPTRWG